MPLREYECQSCHRRIEKIKSFSAPPETVCPHCGGVLEQTLSAPAVQFKGSGWYVTDYAKSGSKKTGAAAAKDSATAEGAPSISASTDKGSSDKASSSESAAPAGDSASKAPAAAPAPATAAAPAAKSD